LERGLVSISLGWIFFLGGIFGTAKILRSSDWRDFNESHEDEPETRHPNRPIKPLAKALILLLNVALCLGGAASIQRKHNWNPFKPCPTCKLDGGAVS
jgi:hypothetical protein